MTDAGKLHVTEGGALGCYRSWQEKWGGKVVGRELKYLEVGKLNLIGAWQGRDEIIVELHSLRMWVPLEHGIEKEDYFHLHRNFMECYSSPSSHPLPLDIRIILNNKWRC